MEDTVITGTNNPKTRITGQNKPEKPKTMDELRKPSLKLPQTRSEFDIVSPDVHVPEGQTTHE